MFGGTYVQWKNRKLNHQFYFGSSIYVIPPRVNYL